MAERQQISTTVSSATRDLVRHACVERKCTQGDLLEAAVLAYLAPNTAPTTEPLLFERLLNIEDTLQQIVKLLQVLVAAQEAQAKPPPPPIATYEQMYGPIDAAPESADEDAGPAEGDTPNAPEPGVPPIRGWRRWFVRETTG